MACFTFFMNLLGAVTALLAVVYAYFQWNYQYWKRKGVVYLEPSFPFGHFENPLRRTMSIGDNITQVYNKVKENGWKFCGFFTVQSPALMVVDLELTKNVMAKDFQHFMDRQVYVNEKDDPLSAHLFSLGGKKWKNLRTKLTPTFTTGKLKAMFQTLVDCGIVLEKYFEANINNTDPVDIKDILGRFTTDVIGSCAFGLECNSFKDPDSPFRRHGKRVFVFTVFDMLKGIFSLNFPKLAKTLGVCTNSEPVRNFFYKLAQDTVEYREKNKIARNDFVQLLLELKNNNKEISSNGHPGDGTSLTMDEIAAQCFIFFSAGFETSSTTMTFTLFELAAHPDIQDKVREEIESVLGRYDDKITYDSLSELKYMKQVIDEVLRKYPPVPFLTRQCVKDYKLPGEDIIIEEGTAVFISVKGIHYDEEHYENPEEFDPERFTEEKKRERHRFAYLPFGEGPRICIGERFGIMQTKVGLTSILRKFRVKLNKKTKIPLKMDPSSFIESTEGSIWLDVEKL
ncbi:hypothetical protein NQ318_020827 [Aromia moschata]|uniref:Cytochrome P450 n=1 Tax=Aromia moschata TaxID=1265417 RepID=A0AAV8X2R9_9CUCU|nr:hypothetical protein NQ318_020827 [Aromia moschata]